VENASALSARRDMFLDERGAGLRVTWHPERDLVVLSVWQDDSCVGTFRMSVHDVPRLSGLLAAALGDWVGHTADREPAARPRALEVGLGGPGRTGDPGAADAGPGGSGGIGDPGAAEAGMRGPGWVGDPGRSRAGAGTGRGGVGGVAGGRGGLSVQRRIRLSRPVLMLRGIRQRRRAG
jgi:hypothetical protein